MSVHEKKRETLRALLLEKKLVRTPVPFDAISALLAEKAGFEAIALGGFPTVGSLLGLPDIGLLTLSGNVDACRRMANITRIPLIVDADNGYGGIPNVVRTVRELENAGASAIVLEDQVFPKRCGHMNGKQLVSMEEFLAKISAAVESRNDPNLAIIARTDARAVVGFDESIRRANQSIKTGADLAFIEAPQSIRELEEIPKRVSGKLLVNMLDFGKPPMLSHDRIGELGYAIVVHPTALLFHHVQQSRSLLKSLHQSGSTASFSGQMASFQDYLELVGMPSFQSMEEKSIHAVRKNQAIE